MNKLILLLIPFVLISAVFASEGNISFSDDFETSEDTIYLNGESFEIPKEFETQLNDLPENIEITNLHVFLIDSDPVVKVNFIAHLKVLIFEYNPEMSVTVNVVNKKIIDIELPFFASFFEDKIIEIVNEKLNSINESIEE